MSADTWTFLGSVAFGVIAIMALLAPFFLWLADTDRAMSDQGRLPALFLACLVLLWGLYDQNLLLIALSASSLALLESSRRWPEHDRHLRRLAYGVGAAGVAYGFYLNIGAVVGLGGMLIVAFSASGKPRTTTDAITPTP